MMKIRLIIVCFCILCLMACNNELNVTADWKSIPVVYALIDANVETNYIRVEKGFLDPDISGETIAQIPDSLYYGDDVTVRITNLRNGTSVNLQRVNLEDEGFTREGGTFAISPNIGYKLNTADLQMEVNEMLKFELIADDDSILTEAQASVIGEYEIPDGQPINPMRYQEDLRASFGLRSSEQAARFYDLRLYINYTEEDINNPGVIENKRLEWIVETGKERGVSSAGTNFISQTRFDFEGQEFFIFLGDNIEENPSIDRNFVSIDLQYDAGGEDLLSYINIGQANTGITSNQIIPAYTNLSNDAIGVFSSRTTLVNIDPYNLNTEARDSLREGRFTEQLNFN